VLSVTYLALNIDKVFGAPQTKYFPQSEKMCFPLVLYIHLVRNHNQRNAIICIPIIFFFIVIIYNHSPSET